MTGGSAWDSKWEAESWDDAPLWFDTLFRILQGHRVHWNLPAMSPEMPARRRASAARCPCGRASNPAGTW